MPDGAHHDGCTLAPDHGGPCWLPEPDPEPLTARELERLRRIPAAVEGAQGDLHAYNVVRAKLGLLPIGYDAQPGDRETLDISAFVERLAETARRADVPAAS